jgi:hypothetical protein
MEIDFSLLCFRAYILTSKSTPKIAESSLVSFGGLDDNSIKGLTYVAKCRTSISCKAYKVQHRRSSVMV